jgi:glucosyl-3-phosphoglycerate synthase
VINLDFTQEEITTLHEIHVQAKQLHKQIQEETIERPVSLVLPMLHTEARTKTLSNIITSLNKCTYLKEVIIPLAAPTEKDFKQVQRFFSKLSIPKLIIWCNSTKITKLLNYLETQGLNQLHCQGKGRDVWLGLGIASIESYGIAVHDADIQGYTDELLTKLLYPLLEPQLDFKFNKGYYARTNQKKTIMYGRVFRLFLHPLLRSLIDVLDHEPSFIRFMRAFGYPISGEFALTSDLAEDLDLPYGWGLEIEVMAEIHRNIATKRICQTDLGFYEHKHQIIGDKERGLIKMSGEIFKSLLRVLIEEDHIQITPSFLFSLQVIYHKNALSCIKKYYADALFNGLTYDRHLEETLVERFGAQLLLTGQQYLHESFNSRLPDWLRTMTARKKIREELLEIVSEQNAI